MSPPVISISPETIHHELTRGDRNHGSGKWLYLYGNYNWRDPFFHFHDYGSKGRSWFHIHIIFLLS